MKRDAGFTLLEMLVVLVVLGLLVGGLAQGSRFGLLALDRGARAVNATAELEASERVLRRLIVEMAPGGAADPVPLRGEAARMNFRSGTERLVRVGLGLRNDGALVLRTADPFAAQPSETMLLEHAASLEIAYWSAGWHNTWNAAELPGLIRIRIGPVQGSGRHWPDIVARPLRERRE